MKVNLFEFLSFKQTLLVLIFSSHVQQVVVAFLGYISDEALKAVLSYLRLYKTAKAPQHTLPTLQDLEKEVETYALIDYISSNTLLTRGLSFFSLLLLSGRFMTDAQVFKDFSPSELNFPKFHAPVHFQLFILLFGRLENLDTETLEQFHHFSAQLPFDNSTKLKDKATQKVFFFFFSAGT